MPLSPAQSGLRFASATFVLGSALNLIAVWQRWAAEFAWSAALAVPATLGVLAWGAARLFPAHPQTPATSRPIGTPRDSKRTIVVSQKHVLTLLLTPLGVSAVVSAVQAHDGGAGLMWLLAAMVTVVVAAMAAKVSRRRVARLPHAHD